MTSTRCTAALAALSPLIAIAQLSAFVDTRIFFDPTKGALVNVDLAVLGASTVEAPNAHGFQQARVEATTIVSKGDSVADFRKTEILGPEHADTVARDFIHAEHFNLAPGEYDLEVELLDLNAGPNVAPVKFKGPLVVQALGSVPAFSDVMLIEPYKEYGGGTALVPFVSTYYPPEVTTLAFHVELYNTEKLFGTDSLFLLTYSIARMEDHKVAGMFQKRSRQRAAEVLPITAQFDISALPSGNYLLTFEAADKRGTAIASRELFFQRNNPVTYDMTDITSVNTNGTFVDAYTDADTLAEHIRSLRPIAGNLEAKIIDDRWKDRDLPLMRSFFFSFWYNRNGYDPEGAWHRYEQLVANVNKLYGCRIKRGYDTDRGYVHLKYGPPNTITDQPNDAAGLPYQIWHYYRCGKYSDKRFVFYLPDRVTGCYELLHSEMPGEVKTPNWNQILHTASEPFNQVQNNAIPMGHGEQVQDMYTIPH